MAPTGAGALVSTIRPSVTVESEECFGPRPRPWRLDTAFKLAHGQVAGARARALSLV